MRVKFRGTRQEKNYEFCCTEVKSYSIRPYSWKEFIGNYWIDHFSEGILSIEMDNLSNFKKKLLKKCEDLDVKKQREYLLDNIEYTLRKNTGFKNECTNYFVNAPETILKNLLSEKKFDLAVVECSNGVRIFVGEEDFLEISEGGEKVTFIGKEEI